MFLHLSVILFTGWGCLGPGPGRRLGGVWPLGKSPGPHPGGRLGGLPGGLQAHTQGVPKPTPLGRVPKPAHTQGVLGPHPGGRGGSRSRPSAEGVPGPGPWGVSQHALRQTLPPQQTATAVGSMHPTGMHSCLRKDYSLCIKNSNDVSDSIYAIIKCK